MHGSIASDQQCWCGLKFSAINGHFLDYRRLPVTSSSSCNISSNAANRLVTKTIVPVLHPKGRVIVGVDNRNLGEGMHRVKMRDDFTKVASAWWQEGLYVLLGL